MMLLQTKDIEDLPVSNTDLVGNDGESSSWGEDNASDLHFSRTASIWTQSILLMNREFLNLGRDKGALIGRFAITSVLNLLFSAIFFQVGDVNKANYDINSHFGAIINIFITGLFGASQPPLLTFPLERVVFLREVGELFLSYLKLMESSIQPDHMVHFLTCLVNCSSRFQ